MYCQSMKKRDIIVVIAVVGLIFAYLAYGKSRSNTVTPEPVATSTPVSEITPFDFEGVLVDTSDWQTYRNEEYGYEFKYPRGWEEVDYYKYLTDPKDIVEQKNLNQKHRVVAFKNSEFGNNSIGLFYRGKGFGYDDLINESKQTGAFTNYKMTEFVSGENTIIIQTLYAPLGSIGYKYGIADVYVWILDKNKEVYNLSGNHNRDGEYISENLKYVIGAYRTFKTIK